MRSRALLPKRRLDSQLVERANEAAEIMAQDLAKNLVHLSDRRLRPDARAELGLNHGEGRLDIRPLVVVRQELVAAIHEQMKGLRPQIARTFWVKAVRHPARRVFLEGNERLRASVDDECIDA